MDRKLWTRLIFIIGILALGFYYVGPWGENLKGGIDLIGGTSQLWEIDTAGLKNPQGAADEVVKVLRKRVDPDNVRNLVWRTVGNTRIEIHMPQPSPKNREISQNYNQAVQALQASNISLSDVHQVLPSSPGAQRDQAWEDLLEEYPDYKARLAMYSRAYEELTKAYEPWKSDPESIDARAKWGTAKLNMRRARQYLLDADINRESLESILGLTGRFDLPVFVSESKDVPNAYDQQVSRLKEQGPETQQRKDAKDSYVWLSEKDLERHIGEKEERAYFKSFKTLQAELEKTGVTPLLAQSALDGKTYILAYASRNRRKIAMERRLTELPSRKDKILIATEFYNSWSKIRGEVEDPASLKRLLRGQGVLEFAILVEGDPNSDELAPEIRRLNEKGPELSQRKAKAGSGEDYAWFKIFNESFRENMGSKTIISRCRQDGKSYVLAHIDPEKTMLMMRDAQGKRVWQLTKATVGRDESGRPQVNFSFDPAGGRIFEELTRANINKPLAVVLDDIVYSAPNIVSIIRRSGRLTGKFTLEETQQLASTMNAGSLAAKLHYDPIREYTIGATMGQENRDRGASAALYALIAVAVFMLVYYLFAGIVANVALFMNLILVLGIMAGVSATFTLPGIAGLILIVGMSVDANVLIFERIREEHLQGASLRMSIQNGYRKVFWTIFDANVTTLITALILYWVGSEQVRGFAITLGYGICMSMFTALFVTRTIFEILVEKGWLKKLPMLRLIKRPNINWMAKRKTFYTISAVLVIGGLSLFVGRSTGLLPADSNLYDIEFAGGTSVWFRMTEPVGDGEVREAIARAGKEREDEMMATASVYAINPSGEERKSRDFKLDTAQTEEDKVEDAIKLAFSDEAGPQLQEQKQIDFELLRSKEYPEGLRPVLEEDVLVGSSSADLKLVDYVGGLKLTLTNLDEPQSLQHLRERIRATRLSIEFSGGQYRKFDVFGLEKADDLVGTEGEVLYKSVVVAVVDRAHAYSPDKAETWKKEFAQNERKLVVAALQQASRFQGITKFNPEVAAEEKIKAGFAIVLALLAIVGYVWIRFGKGRYGLAAIIALAHDVFAVLGLVALATFVYYTPLGRLLGISDLRIDMTMIAALLTIIGYSLNDTIVVFDRIRENRGRLADISPTIVNNSINQTMSRTLLTSLTTLMAVVIMYCFGGPGIHGFTSAMILGVLVGTYSSIAIASPTVLLIGKFWQKWDARNEAKAAAAKQAARK